MSNDNSDDQPSILGRVIVFVLTIVAVPILFVATCFPLGVVSLNVAGSINSALPHGSERFAAYLFVGVIAAYVLFFFGFGGYRAVKTSNPAIRWGLVVALAAMIITAVLFFVQYPQLLGLNGN